MPGVSSQSYRSRLPGHVRAPGEGRTLEGHKSPPLDGSPAPGHPRAPISLPGRWRSTGPGTVRPALQPSRARGAAQRGPGREGARRGRGREPRGGRREGAHTPPPPRIRRGERGPRGADRPGHSRGWQPGRVAGRGVRPGPSPGSPPEEVTAGSGGAGGALLGTRAGAPHPPRRAGGRDVAGTRPGGEARPGPAPRPERPDALRGPGRLGRRAKRGRGWGGRPASAAKVG